MHDLAYYRLVHQAAHLYCSKDWTNGPNCYYYLLHQIKEQRNKIHEAIKYIALPPCSTWWNKCIYKTWQR